MHGLAACDERVAADMPVTFGSAGPGPGPSRLPSTGSRGASPAFSVTSESGDGTSKWGLIREIHTKKQASKAEVRRRFVQLVQEAHKEQSHPCDLSAHISSVPGSRAFIDEDEIMTGSRRKSLQRAFTREVLKEAYASTAGRSLTNRRRRADARASGGERPNMTQFMNDKQPPWLIDPRTSQNMAKWDIITAIALAFTALFTPYEIAYLGAPKDWTERLFLINRLVDLIFLIDMCLQFFLMVPVSDRYGDRWISDRRTLVCNYLKGWFPMDLFSTAISVVDLYAARRRCRRRRRCSQTPPPLLGLASRPPCTVPRPPLVHVPRP